MRVAVKQRPVPRTRTPPVEQPRRKWLARFGAGEASGKAGGMPAASLPTTVPPVPHRIPGGRGVECTPWRCVAASRITPPRPRSARSGASRHGYRVGTSRGRPTASGCCLPSCMYRWRYVVTLRRGEGGGEQVPRIMQEKSGNRQSMARAVEYHVCEAEEIKRLLENLQDSDRPA